MFVPHASIHPIHKNQIPFALIPHKFSISLIMYTLCHGVKYDIFAKFHMIVVTISRMDLKIKTFFTFVGNATAKCSNKCTSS
jgi:hypothetical protein